MKKEWLDYLAVSWWGGLVVGVMEMVRLLRYGLVTQPKFWLEAVRGAGVEIFLIWAAGGVIWMAVYLLGKRSRRVGWLIYGVMGLFLLGLEVEKRVVVSDVAKVLLLLVAMGGLYKVIGWLDGRGRPQVYRWVGGVLMGCLLVITVGRRARWWGLGMNRSTKGEEPNVILITADALRADKFNKELMPKTWSFFEGGVRGERVYVTSPWTAPSFVSLWTGKYPSQVAADRGSKKLEEDFVWLDELETVAERFNKLGYDTRAVVTNQWLTEERGVGQGFDWFVNVEDKRHYHWGGLVEGNGVYQVARLLGREEMLQAFYEYWVGEVSEMVAYTTRAGMVTSQAEKELANLREPYLIWVHYIDPHDPYMPPADFMPDEQYGLSEQEALEVWSQENKKWDEARKKYVRKLYEGDVKYMDGEIGRLLAYVGRRENKRKSVVVFTSDHGEHLFDRDGIGLGHGRALTEELVRVPWAVKLPEGEEGEMEEVMSLIDFGGWLLGGVRGDGWDWPEREYIWFEALESKEQEKGLIYQGRWKLVKGGGDSKLYDFQRGGVDVEQVGKGGELRNELETKLGDWKNGFKEEREVYLDWLKGKDKRLQEVIGY